MGLQVKCAPNPAMNALEVGLLPPMAIGGAGGAKFSLVSSIVTSSATGCPECNAAARK
jgi:hypothetical protein